MSIWTVYRCQDCGNEHRVEGERRLHVYGPYCSNHDPDGPGALYIAVEHVVVDESPSAAKEEI